MATLKDLEVKGAARISGNASVDGNLTLASSGTVAEGNKQAVTGGAVATALKTPINIARYASEDCSLASDAHNTFQTNQLYSLGFSNTNSIAQHLDYLFLFPENISKYTVFGPLSPFNSQAKCIISKHSLEWDEFEDNRNNHTEYWVEQEVSAITEYSLGYSQLSTAHRIGHVTNANSANHTGNVVWSRWDYQQSALHEFKDERSTVQADETINLPPAKYYYLGANSSSITLSKNCTTTYVLPPARLLPNTFVLFMRGGKLSTSEAKDHGNVLKTNAGNTVFSERVYVPVSGGESVFVTAGDKIYHVCTAQASTPGGPSSSDLKGTLYT